MIQGSTGDRAALEDLLKELREALGETPAEQAEAAQTVEVLAQQSVDQLKQEQPNKTLLQMTLSNLQTAAKGLVDYAPKVVDIAGKVVALIGKIAAL